MPRIYSSTVASQAETLEAFLASPEYSTASDPSPCVSSGAGVALTVGWFRDLARSLRHAEEIMRVQEPQEASSVMSVPSHY